MNNELEIDISHDTHDRCWFCAMPRWWVAGGKNYCAYHLPSRWHAQASMLARVANIPDSFGTDIVEWLMERMALERSVVQQRESVVDDDLAGRTHLFVCNGDVKTEVSEFEKVRAHLDCLPEEIRAQARMLVMAAGVTDG